jgi:Cysteine-rich secretory protein family
MIMTIPAPRAAVLLAGLALGCAASAAPAPAILTSAALVLQAPAPAAPSDAAMFARANAARRAMGAPPFVWDEGLAACAREAVRNNWDSHEFWLQRAAKYGADNEGSFPAVYSLDGIFDMMRSHPRMSRGAHAQQFRDPAHRRIGMAYGGNGPTSGGSFFIFVYGR